MIKLLLFVLISYCQAGSKSKPHPHQGHLQPYDGKHIAYNITQEQNQKLNSGQPVTFNERSGKSGRGFSLQDVAAPPHICMNRISDLANYPNMVPKVKKMELYDQVVFSNGTTKVGAFMQVGISLLSFGYYLMCTYEPKYQTFTWTLDYRYSSDFEDNTGHWQVLPHPHKKGWSRVLYSTEVQLTPWIPEFVITFLTKTALVESTTWVRYESEKLAASPEAAKVSEIAMPDISSCFVEDEHYALYLTHCYNDPVSTTTVNNDFDVISSDGTDLDNSTVTEGSSIVSEESASQDEKSEL